MSNAKISELTAKTTIESSDLIPVVDETGTPTTKKITARNLFTGKTACLYVAASNSSAYEQLIADYVCDGTADEVQIQAAIDALPTNGGVVELSVGTFSTSAAISWAKNSVILKGQGIDATKITATAATFNAIKVGNRQSDSTMRNFNRIEDMTVSLAGGSSNFAVIKFDGAGQGSQINNVCTNEGKYGMELMDLDRCSFKDIYINNPRTAGIFLEVGLENTYGTVTFINPSIALSDASSTCLLMDSNAGQASPNAIDRVTIIGALWFSTSGLSGTKGIEANVGVTSFVEIGSLSESPIYHVKLTGANSQLCQMDFIGCSFIQNSGVSTDIFQFNTLNHIVTVQDCRLQQATNAFNGVSGYSIVNLLGRNNNQGNITNVFAGTFGAKQGTDTVFAGNDILALGLDNQRFSYVFGQKYTLADGITAPSASSGLAHIFIDSNDGDLKIIYGDGTVKTIVVDT